MNKTISSRFACVVGAFALVFAGFSGAAFAGQEKFDICHVEGNGDYHLINVAEPALDAHYEHGDLAATSEVQVPASLWGQDEADEKCPDRCDSVDGEWNGDWESNQVIVKCRRVCPPDGDVCKKVCVKRIKRGSCSCDVPNC